MNKEKAFRYFKSNFKINKSKNGWFRFSNPFDKHKDLSMAVNFEYAVVHCFRTGYKEFIMNFISDYENIEFYEAKKLLNSYEEEHFNFEDLNLSTSTKKILNIPEGFNSLYSETSFGQRARNYLIKRGFDIALLDNLGFGYMNVEPYFGYIFIPFRIKGKLNYYIFRDFIGNSIKYLNPPTEEILIGKSELFFNEDALKLYKEVNLVEGWSDAMTLGKNTIASLGWSLSTTQKSKIIKSSIKILNIIPDRGFYEKSLLLAAELSDYIETVNVFDFDKHIELYDENGKHLKDVNDCGQKLMNERLKHKQKFSYSMF